MILYRHADPRFPFLWESSDQPPGRWHGSGEGPVHYLSDTPDGAWAEFLRHEGITEEEVVENVRRALWVIEAPDGVQTAAPALPMEALIGGIDTYEVCRAEARRWREQGARALRAPSAALLPGGAAGWKVDRGLRRAAERDATNSGRPGLDMLARVRHL